jgi:hypothetical protein
MDKYEQRLWPVGVMFLDKTQVREYVIFIEREKMATVDLETGLVKVHKKHCVYSSL